MWYFLSNKLNVNNTLHEPSSHNKELKALYLAWDLTSGIKILVDRLTYVCSTRYALQMGKTLQIVTCMSNTLRRIVTRHLDLVILFIVISLLNQCNVIGLFGITYKTIFVVLSCTNADPDGNFVVLILIIISWVNL